MDCPDPETLAAYREGGAPSPALEAHFLDCPSCREALILLGHGTMHVRTIPWIRWAAAAVILIVGLAFWKGRPPPPVQPEAVKALSADLVLEAGARVLPEGRGKVRALGGRFWVEASGEPVEILLPSTALRLKEGAIAVDLPTSRVSCLLREAQAAESGRVWVLEGVLQVGEGLFLRAGQSLSLDPAARPQASDPKEMDALRKARALAAAAQGTAIEKASGALPRFRWVSVLRRRAASTELGLRFPIGGVWYQWVPGLASKGVEDPEVVEVLWDGARLVGRVNGRTLLSARAGEITGLLRASPEKGWKVSGWGGSLDLESSRVKAP